MPRNGSGTHSIPNSFSSGTTISSSAVNANFTDVATEITNSLPRDGQAAMTGQLKAAAGSTSAPGITFGSDTDTGFYRKSANTIGIVAGGAEVGTISETGQTDLNGVAVVGMPVGDMMMYGATTAPSGWLRCNGRTIGNASSGATERANADTSSLFTFLWTNYADSVCAVSSGRGASAAADYAANKTITLPDLRGRAFFGLDDMGGTAANRLGSVITSQTTNGASGGTETHTLTEAQLPSHTHTASSDAISSPVFKKAITRSLGSIGGGSFDIVLTHDSASDIGGSYSPTAVSAHTHTIGNAGSGSAHSNMPPAFLTTFIIKL